MSRKETEDFPFGYLSENQTSERGARPIYARAGRGGVRITGKQEIEKLLVIAIAMTLVFVALLTATILLVHNKEQAGPPDIRSATTDESAQLDSETEEAKELESETEPAKPSETTGSTGLSLVQIG